MWAIFKLNVLLKMASYQFSNDTDAFAEFYADEYDKAIKSGGDILNGVNVINGNKVAFAAALKSALKKGTQSVGSNYNILQELYPCFDQYWLGAEMSPLPNPLLKPLGWPSTIPATGAIQNIGPNPVALATSAALHKAEVEALKVLENELKSKIITIELIPPATPLIVNVYDTLQKILKKEAVDDIIKSHPTIIAGKEILYKLKEAKKKKPSIGSQFKKALKIEWPKLPDRKKIIEEAKKQAKEKVFEELKKQLIEPIEEVILSPIQQLLETTVELLDSIPKPKPTKVQIKKFIKDTVDGIVPDITIPGIDLTKLNVPTKAELQSQIEDKLPTKPEIDIMVEDILSGKLPDVPFFNINMPSYIWSSKTNVMIDPFINIAKLHLYGTSGNMMVMAQYPPPMPPAPAIIKWEAYRIVDGPPVPDLPMTVKFPNVELGFEIPKFPELPEAPLLALPDIISIPTLPAANLPIPTIVNPIIG
jgi:hypothetical protein